MGYEHAFVKNREERKRFKVQWKKGLTNAVDYFTKNHPTVYHRTERKKYIRDQMYEQDTHKTVRVYQSYH